MRRYMGPISSSLQPEGDGEWVRYTDVQADINGVVEELERRAGRWADEAKATPENWKRTGRSEGVATGYSAAANLLRNLTEEGENDG